MAGTKVGAAKRRATIIKKHGSLGAYNKVHTKKFRKTMIEKSGGEEQYLEEQRKRAAKGGRKGGLASRSASLSTTVEQPNSVRKAAYKNESASEQLVSKINQVK